MIFKDAVAEYFDAQDLKSNVWNDIESRFSPEPRKESHKRRKIVFATGISAIAVAVVTAIVLIAVLLFPVNDGRPTPARYNVLLRQVANAESLRFETVIDAKAEDGSETVTYSGKSVSNEAVIDYKKLSQNLEYETQYYLRQNAVYENNGQLGYKAVGGVASSDIYNYIYVLNEIEAGWCKDVKTVASPQGVKITLNIRPEYIDSVLKDLAEVQMYTAVGTVVSAEIVIESDGDMIKSLTISVKIFVSEVGKFINLNIHTEFNDINASFGLELPTDLQQYVQVNCDKANAAKLLNTAMMSNTLRGNFDLFIENDGDTVNVEKYGSTAKITYNNGYGERRDRIIESYYSGGKVYEYDSLTNEKEMRPADFVYDFYRFVPLFPLNRPFPNEYDIHFTETNIDRAEAFVFGGKTYIRLYMCNEDLTTIMFSSKYLVVLDGYGNIEYATYSGSGIVYGQHYSTNMSCLYSERNTAPLPGYDLSEYHDREEDAYELYLDITSKFAFGDTYGFYVYSNNYGVFSESFIHCDETAQQASIRYLKSTEIYGIKDVQLRYFFDGYEFIEGYDADGYYLRLKRLCSWADAKELLLGHFGIGDYNPMESPQFRKSELRLYPVEPDQYTYEVDRNLLLKYSKFDYLDYAFLFISNNSYNLRFGLTYENRLEIQVYFLEGSELLRPDNYNKYVLID